MSDERDDLDLAIVLLHTIATTQRADGRLYWRHYARRALASMKSERARSSLTLLDTISKRHPG